MCQIVGEREFRAVGLRQRAQRLNAGRPSMRYGLADAAQDDLLRLAIELQMTACGQQRKTLLHGLQQGLA